MMGYGSRKVRKKVWQQIFCERSCRDRDRIRDQRQQVLLASSLLALPSACAGVHASTSEG